MTRIEQQARDPRYRDWRAAYKEDVIDRVKHWGDRRKSSGRSSPKLNGKLDSALLEPGR